MLPLEEAVEKLLESCQTLPAELVSLGAAAGRILAEDCRARVDLPVFDNSAMDGYAVRADDLAGADPLRHVKLKVAGTIAAGQRMEGELAPGTCARIFTGSWLPARADAVVMQEDVAVEKETGLVVFREPVKPWENVRFRGEDISAGRVLAEAGTRLRSAHLAAIAANGFDRISVHARPTLGIVATGSELREAGAVLADGEIYESNRVMLASLAESTAGAVPVQYPLAADDLNATCAALRTAFLNSDVVVTTGGASVGEFDHVKEAFRQLGGELRFWRVAMKPGKPFLFGRWHGKSLFGLPGNPVSAFVTFLLLVRPALLRMQGCTDLELPSHPGRLMAPVSNLGDRRHFLRVRVNDSGQVFPSGGQRSHFLSSLCRANGLVDLGVGAKLVEGEMTRVLRWEF